MADHLSTQDNIESVRLIPNLDDILAVFIVHELRRTRELSNLRWRELAQCGDAAQEELEPMFRLALVLLDDGAERFALERVDGASFAASDRCGAGAIV